MTPLLKYRHVTTKAAIIQDGIGLPPARFSELMAEAQVLDYIRNKGLTVVEPPTSTFTDDEVVVDAVAAGLLPEERLEYHGWRAIFHAP